METKRLLGDNLYTAFKQIKGDEFEAFWGDLEHMFGTSNRGEVAMRWMALNFSLQNHDGFRVMIVQDILKNKNIGKRLRMTKDGSMGSYTHGDVEAVFDAVRENDGSWQGGLRRDAVKADGTKYAPGEKLMEDLRGMTREEWYEEVNRSGLNSPDVTRVSQSAADDIWHMANGPEVEPSGRRTATRTCATRGVPLAQLPEPCATKRSTWRGRSPKIWATGRGMTEEEFIKLHFTDIPRWSALADDVAADSLFDIRPDWALTAMNRREGMPAPVDAYNLRQYVQDNPGIPSPYISLMKETEESGDYWMYPMKNWDLDDVRASIESDDTLRHHSSLPKRGYHKGTEVLFRADPQTSVLRIKKTMGGESAQPVNSTGAWSDDADLLDIDLLRDEVEVLTPEGWKRINEPAAVKVTPTVAPPLTTEAIAGNYLYDSGVIDEASGLWVVDAKALATMQERAATRGYGGLDYMVINSWLRGLDSESTFAFGPMPDEDEMKDLVEMIDRSIMKGQLREPKTVFRGVDLDDPDDLTIDYANLEPGDDFADPAFMSTSVDRVTAEGFANKADLGLVITARLPGGMHANMILHEGSETELILQRDVPMKVLTKTIKNNRDGTRTIHMTVVPTGEGVRPGVNQLALGEMAPVRKREGKLIQEAVTNPDGLRYRVKLQEPETAEALSEIVEETIAKAANAGPAAGEIVTYGGMRYGRLTPQDTLDDIVATLDNDEILAARVQLAALRGRLRELLTSDALNDVGQRSREVVSGNDVRVLAALAPAILAKGGVRRGFGEVYRVMEDVWDRGLAAVAGPKADPLAREMATHLFRGIRYAIDDPYVTSHANDALDALLGNTSRRATGRVDDVQPIFADDLVAEAAGFLTPSAANELIDRGLLPEVGAGVAREPIPTGLLTWESELGGSTGAVKMRDPASGKAFVDKKGASPGHITEEHIADDVYEAMGVAVPHQNLIEVGGQVTKRAEMIEDATPLNQFVRTASPEELASVKAQIQQHFVLDALLSNWDVVGLVGDNILIKDGVVYRVDNGGALRYRAMGAPKGGRFGEDVSELDTLRNADMNEWAARMFTGITDAEIRRQALDVSQNLDTVLAALPSELRSVVSARMDSILDQTAGITPAADRPSRYAAAAAEVGPTPKNLDQWDHEYLVKHYNDLAKHANSVGFAGRDDWTAAEMAQVAAHSRMKQGRPEGITPTVEELERKLPEIQSGATPGPGIPELYKFNELFEILSQRRYRTEKAAVMRRGSLILQQEIRQRLGIVSEGSDEIGVGLWNGDESSSILSTHLFNSHEKAMTAADAMSYATGQPGVRVWSHGPSRALIEQGGAWGAYTPRVTITVPANDTNPRLAEKLAEQIGKSMPGANDAAAIRQADGSWNLSIYDPDGTVLSRLPSGEVDEEAVRASMEDILRGVDDPNLPDTIDMHVDYGHHYSASPKTLEDGTHDWAGYREEVVSRAASRGTTIGAGDLDAIRGSYHGETARALQDAAPDNYARIQRNEPTTRDLEDRRGGQVLGVTSPEGAVRGAIRGFTAADAKTGLHELVHIFRLSNMDPSLQAAVSRAYDAHSAATGAAKQARVDLLKVKIANTTSPTWRTRWQSEITALEHDLATPHPSEWGTDHEEFFVTLVMDWINRGVPSNPDLAQAFNHFRNWTNLTQQAMTGPGMPPVQVSDQMSAVLNRMFSRPPIDTVSYSVEDQVLRTAAQQAVRSSWDEAHATQYYKQDRSMLERSINHPYIGLYPASYMWGKILPEMVRFLALRPFGMATPVPWLERCTRGQ